MNQVLYGIAFVFAQTLLFAQDVEVQKDCPVAISVKSPNKAPVSVQLELSNTSGKDILAFVVIAREKGGDGKARTVAKGIQTSPGGPTPFGVGKRWLTRLPQVYDREKNIVDSIISVDYIHFADHSVWGADSQKLSLEVKGFMAGERATRERLKKLLEERGADAVASEVKASRP